MLKTLLASPAVAAGALCASLLAAPLTPAFAQSRAQGDSKMAAKVDRMTAHAETVDQRIADLHAELKITPSEEADWKAVAQTMRDNAAAMEKLAQEKSSESNQGMSAIEDLETYQQFAQTHVDGLKTLVTTFKTLYQSMPETQKKLADQVFQQSRHDTAQASG